MGLRTNPQLVRDALEIDEDINLNSHIDLANALTDKVASEDTNSELSDALLLGIETRLACHFASRRDMPFASKTTGKASATFQGQTGMRLESTHWGQDAMTLDVTGYLNTLNRGRVKASLSWLGLPPSEQTDYVDRD